MTLIRNIHESQSQQTLVTGIIGYCHDNGIKVIAEGIETQEEMDTVIELKCTRRGEFNQMNVVSTTVDKNPLEEME